MKFLAALTPCALVALAVSVRATARPLIIEESTTIENPDAVREGSGGLVTFKAAASFNDYSAYQP